MFSDYVLNQISIIFFSSVDILTDFGTLPGPLLLHALCEFVLDLQNPNVGDDKRVLNSVHLQSMSNLHCCL